MIMSQYKSPVYMFTYMISVIYLFMLINIRQNLLLCDISYKNEEFYEDENTKLRRSNYKTISGQYMNGDNI